MNAAQANEAILARLFAMQDVDYRDFHCRLIPTVDRERVIGVRAPMLRRFARSLCEKEEAQIFLQTLPHQYYEENNLHGFLIEEIDDFDACIAALDAFLPYVDNWATCDMLSPKVFKRSRERLLPQLRRWLQSDRLYTVRFAVDMLMKHYLDDDSFAPESMAWVCGLRSEEFYLKMAIAWYFATALTKQYEAALPCIQERRLDAWTHNKAIQKALESRRISPEQKTLLRSLKIPGTAIKH